MDRAITEVCLYWIPLGVGGRVVRWNGRLYEAVVAHVERRPACDLYHAAIEVRLRSGWDELRAGDMWNSNSLVAWLLARPGHDMTVISPPHGGRAPAGARASSWRHGRPGQSTLQRG